MTNPTDRFNTANNSGSYIQKIQDIAAKWQDEPSADLVRDLKDVLKESKVRLKGQDPALTALAQETIDVMKPAVINPLGEFHNNADAQWCLGISLSHIGRFHDALDTLHKAYSLVGQEDHENQTKIGHKTAHILHRIAQREQNDKFSHAALNLVNNLPPTEAVVSLGKKICKTLNIPTQGQSFSDGSPSPTQDQTLTLSRE